MEEREREREEGKESLKEIELTLPTNPLPILPPLPHLTKMYGKARATAKLVNQLTVVVMATATGRAS